MPYFLLDPFSCCYFLVVVVVYFFFVMESCTISGIFYYACVHIVLDLGESATLKNPRNLLIEPAVFILLHRGL